ncbi:MAG: hypothetical protein ACYSU0_12365 [Planctomycetota bacterium]
MRARYQDEHGDLTRELELPRNDAEKIRRMLLKSLPESLGSTGAAIGDGPFVEVSIESALGKEELWAYREGGYVVLNSGLDVSSYDDRARCPRLIESLGGPTPEPILPDLDPSTLVITKADQEDLPGSEVAEPYRALREVLDSRKVGVVLSHHKLVYLTGGTARAVCDMLRESIPSSAKTDKYNERERSLADVVVFGFGRRTRDISLMVFRGDYWILEEEWLGAVQDGELVRRIACPGVVSRLKELVASMPKITVRDMYDQIHRAKEEASSGDTGRKSAAPDGMTDVF